ncbi:glycoside hydrolase family 76 protein [Cohnella sp. REN36]|uniref:glycoside hydrolase family 76 protein n=1 Tax=Cohnella sp. REN36 TaxID=2887347 RepID=UPI001D145252|nr:glycoside hydrolase family 76 protein [Cohnella sp. REN36]MCC3376866.1 AGE family epimerase/isomerase [Cohnella sp. REN36]
MNFTKLPVRPTTVGQRQVRAETAQEELIYSFWNERLGIMNQLAPYEPTCNDHFVYWWHAHVIDALADGYERTRNAAYLDRVDRVIEGVRRLNGGTLLHNYYDDMEWMALALLRVYDATKRERYRTEADILWASIQTAWNDHMGGGMAWKKDQLDYKNTPANAPAAILAARLYQRFERPEDLQWALRIYEWNRANLVDPETGFVWDGMNRQGDGKIDYDWHYTYCQGVYIGAGLELYRIIGDSGYLEDAVRTADAAIARFTLPDTGLLPDEGKDDCGLFKGIFVRYLHELLKLRPERSNIRELLLRNADALWETGRSEQGLISRSWTAPVETEVQLCAQLSGLMLLEMAAALPAGEPGPNDKTA